MNDSPSLLERINRQLRNNPVIALLIVLGSLVIGLSTFSNAARNLMDLVPKEGRPDINGTWKAEVNYDWPNAKYTEAFVLRGDAQELRGTASFLGVDRGIVDGNVKAGRLQFVTRTPEMTGEATKDVTHRYSGRLVGDELQLEVMVDGSATPHVPVLFTAHRVAGAVASP